MACHGLDISDTDTLRYFRYRYGRIGEGLRPTMPSPPPPLDPPRQVMETRSTRPLSQEVPTIDPQVGHSQPRPAPAAPPGRAETPGRRNRTPACLHAPWAKAASDHQPDASQLHAERLLHPRAPRGHSLHPQGAPGSTPCIPRAPPGVFPAPPGSPRGHSLHPREPPGAFPAPPGHGQLWKSVFVSPFGCLVQFTCNAWLLYKRETAI